MATKFKIFPAQLAFIFLLATHICSAQTGIWTELYPTNSPTPRMAFGMAEIGDGKLIIFGGQDANKIFDETWIYDYKENNWTQVNTNIHPSVRERFQMARISKNKVLLFGGSGPTNIIPLGYSDETWIFDLDSLKWSIMDPLNKPVRRDDFCMAQLTENKVILFGGILNDTSDAHHFISDETWIYDLNKNNWTAMSDMYEYKRPPYCEGAMLAQIDTGKVLFYGGWNIVYFLDETWLFELSTLKWKKIEPISKSIPISHSSMANLRKNEVVFWGGDIDHSGHYNELWLFNLIDSSWKNIPTNEKPDGRFLHCISKLGSDSVLLFGGLNNKVGTMHNDTWLLSMDSVEDVFENISNEIKNQNSILIQNNKVRIPTKYAGLCNYKLYNIYGKIMKEKHNELMNNYIDFDATDLLNGIYFLVVQEGTEREIIKLLLDKLR